MYESMIEEKGYTSVATDALEGAVFLSLLQNALKEGANSDYVFKLAAAMHWDMQATAANIDLLQGHIDTAIVESVRAALADGHDSYFYAVVVSAAVANRLSKSLDVPVPLETPLEYLGDLMCQHGLVI